MLLYSFYKKAKKIDLKINVCNISSYKSKMAETIVDGTLLNAQNIKFSAPKANASGGKSVNILNKMTNSGL